MFLACAWKKIRMQAQKESDFGNFANRCEKSFENPTFDINDEKAYTYLEGIIFELQFSITFLENGYVVFKNVLTENEVQEGKSLAWDFFESINRVISEEGNFVQLIDRNNHNTWNSTYWPASPGTGL
jgi:hypothetical protein